MARSKQIRGQQPNDKMLHHRINHLPRRRRTMTAGKAAAKHVAISRALPLPIQDFRIPVSKAELPMDVWDLRAPHRIHYGIPERVKYGAEDQGQVEFLRVPASKEGLLVGYVPLPIKYRSSWVYLCYCVEYWLAVWKCWDVQSKKKMQRNRKELVVISRKNAGARFLEAMVARRAVVEECLIKDLNQGRINTLDEFLIRDQRDWLFLEFDELPEDADRYLEADPLHAENKMLFRRCS
jgi:hypothetical protein